MLPGATWEAVHELRATGESPQSVDLASYAIVTQTTGEDWRGAKISFSTQSPTKAAQIPELDALLLGDSQAVRRIAGDQHRTFNQALQRYRGQNTDWFNVKNPTMNIIDYSSNQRGQVLIEAKFIEIAKELEKRGTTAHFAGKGNPTIRGDGNPVRVQIGAATLEAASEIVAAPRASLNAARVVKMTNNSEQPFLPGRLSLYKDGAFLGVTDTEFVAQGESFSVFLGVADQVKLSRTIDQKRSSVVRGKKSRMQAVFLIAVENLSAGAMTLNLADRIPVSQRKDIRVYRVEIEPAVEPDSKGLLKWNVSLEAKEKKVFTIGYTVEYLQEVLDALNAAPSQSRPSKGNRVLQDINSSMMMIK